MRAVKRSACAAWNYPRWREGVPSPEPFLRGILEELGPAAIHGLIWHYSPPPIAGLEFEMDMRGVRRELRIGNY